MKRETELSRRVHVSNFTSLNLHPILCVELVRTTSYGSLMVKLPNLLSRVAGSVLLHVGFFNLVASCGCE
jgi:hypothetical protein